jgi:hypothetical protein
MTIHGFTSRNYAAQIDNTTVITRAYDRANAVTFLKSKNPLLKDSDVYNYDGSGPDPVDEVYSEEERKWDGQTRSIIKKDIYKVRMRDEYAHLG